MKKELRVLFIGMPDIGHVCDNFKRADVTLNTVNTVKLAILRLEEESYDLVVTNSSLEDGDASEVREALNRMSLFPPLIGVSTDSTTRKLMLNGGFTRAVSFEEAEDAITKQLNLLSQ